jgi:hypothetical protein
MKKTFLVIALFIAASFNVQAQDSEFKEDALKMTKMAEGMVDSMMGQLYSMIPEDNLEAFKKELNPIMDEYYVNATEVSMKHYTHEEVKEILKFYESEIGQTMLEKQGKIMKETMALSQGLQMKIMPLVQKYTQ